MLESQIQKRILDHLNRLDECWVVKVMTCNKNGTPDILVCYQGRFIAIEVKTDTGKTSPIQDYQLAKIAASGGSAYVVRSLEEAKEIFT